VIISRSPLRAWMERRQDRGPRRRWLVRNCSIVSAPAPQPAVGCSTCGPYGLAMTVSAFLLLLGLSLLIIVISLLGIRSRREGRRANSSPTGAGGPASRSDNVAVPDPPRSARSTASANRNVCRQPPPARQTAVAVGLCPPARSSGRSLYAADAGWRCGLRRGIRDG